MVPCDGLCGLSRGGMLNYGGVNHNPSGSLLTVQAGLSRTQSRSTRAVSLLYGRYCRSCRGWFDGLPLEVWVARVSTGPGESNLTITAVFYSIISLTRLFVYTYGIPIPSQDNQYFLLFSLDIISCLVSSHVLIIIS
jgi:hypothetical protein